jgi:MoxR-like ATPase
MCYIINEDELNTIYLALCLEKPLLVSGPAGVGKTELAKVLSDVLGARLIRLQCHEGLDESKSLYDWNIQRQLINIHLSSRTQGSEKTEEDLFSLDYILQRPLLQAITQQEQVLLLIDEIDRSDAGSLALSSLPGGPSSTARDIISATRHLLSLLKGRVSANLILSPTLHSLCSS